MGYSNHTSGNARITYLAATGTGLNLATNLSALGSATTGQVGIAGVNLAAAVTTAKVGDISLFVKGTGEGVETFPLQDTQLKSKLAVTVVANPTPAAAIVVGSAKYPTPLINWILKIYDTTEGTEPSHIEEYSYTSIGSSSAAAGIVNTYEQKVEAYLAKGLGVKPRFVVSAEGDKVKVAAIDGKTSGFAVLISDGPVKYPEVLGSAGIVPTSIAANQITLEDAEQLWQEGVAYSGGYNEAGWKRERYADIGDGGIKPAVGDEIYFLDYDKEDYSKARPKTVAKFKGTVALLVRNSDAKTNIKAALGIA